LADFPDRVFVFMVEPQGQLITEFQCSWTLNNGKG
jgi:hypothetical protein